MAEVEKVFKSMEFPKEMLTDVQEKLQGAHNSEKDYYKNKINELNKRLGVAHMKLDRLIDMRLSSDHINSITEDMFARKRTEIEKEIANLKTDVAMHDIANEKFKTLVVTVFSLASEAHELFLYSTMSERRSFIDYVFSDITLTGKKLSYSLRCPFDLMLENASCDTWLPITSELRTCYFDLSSKIETEVGSRTMSKYL